MQPCSQVVPIHYKASGAAAAGPVAPVTVPDHHFLALGPTVQQLFPEVALELGSFAPQLALVQLLCQFASHCRCRSRVLSLFKIMPTVPPPKIMSLPGLSQTLLTKSSHLALLFSNFFRKLPSNLALLLHNLLLSNSCVYLPPVVSAPAVSSDCIYSWSCLWCLFQ